MQQNNRQSHDIPNYDMALVLRSLYKSAINALGVDRGPTTYDAFMTGVAIDTAIANGPPCRVPPREYILFERAFWRAKDDMRPLLLHFHSTSDAALMWFLGVLYHTLSHNPIMLQCPDAPKLLYREYVGCTPEGYPLFGKSPFCRLCEKFLAIKNIDEQLREYASVIHASDVLSESTPWPVIVADSNSNDVPNRSPSSFSTTVATEHPPSEAVATPTVIEELQAIAAASIASDEFFEPIWAQLYTELKKLASTPMTSVVTDGSLEITCPASIFHRVVDTKRINEHLFKAWIIKTHGIGVTANPITHGGEWKFRVPPVAHPETK